MTYKEMTFKELLKMRGLTQEQLAKKLKVSQQTISQWCVGATAPGRKLWSKVAKTLSVSVEQLLNCFEK